MGEETELLELIRELRDSPDFQFESACVKRKFELFERALKGDVQSSTELKVMFDRK
jgi:hypothetical protein